MRGQELWMSITWQRYLRYRHTWCILDDACSLYVHTVCSLRHVILIYIYKYICLCRCFSLCMVVCMSLMSQDALMACFLSAFGVETARFCVQKHSIFTRLQKSNPQPAVWTNGCWTKNRGFYPRNGWWKYRKTLLIWMIWGVFPYFWKHPNELMDWMSSNPNFHRFVWCSIDSGTNDQRSFLQFWIFKYIEFSKTMFGSPQKLHLRNNHN